MGAESARRGFGHDRDGAARKGEISARELTREERIAFYRDTLNPFAHRSRVVSWIVRHIDGLDIDDPDQEAAKGPVFEIRWVSRGPVTRSES